MSLYQLLSYDDVFQRTKNGSRYLLLGNGFSIAYDRDRFSFKNLFDYAINKKLIMENQPLSNIFAEFETYDFERIIRKLEETELIFSHYNSLFNDEIIRIFSKKIIDDSEFLKNLLVDVLSQLHPESSAIIDKYNYDKAKEFIKEYDSIFTLNYDLLLIWVSLKLEDDINYKNITKLKVNDGFRLRNDNLTFIENNSEQTIYYLHGALHIFAEAIEITKISSKNKDNFLIPQIKENISYCSKYPLFISEGTWQNKLLKIKKNIYLNHCYNSLKNLSFYNNNNDDDSLVIFGTLLKSNDNHILEAIKQNNIKNIYIGVSSEKKIYTDCSHIIKKLDETKNIYFYNYNTVSVWR